ncbi:hypothetical protein E1B28_012233 [Marasmius oreades]|uniref:Mitochondrial K+-H+ exchange-related-domain-containing protein n=1 Tax=Marasmius oreades TaxID=181124 RepID=A0A9P7UPQ1_9AGAR|nr:uncharacterized protein E1B28_012233 [Marasmius oreades]KAG7088216.1 hypothetical protein E1B28_012233 [Marasmius oreades]
MHATKKSMRSVQRIISVPITRPTATQQPTIPLHPLDHSKILTYYHFQLHSTSQSPGSSSKWLSWMQTKAASTWSNFGKAPEGTWKLKVFRAGERIVDRIDFEELSLKGVDPSLGPTILHPDISGRRGEKNVPEGDNASKIVIPLLYPPSIQSGEVSLEHLRSLLSTRKPRHKRGAWLWITIAPFTAPFMVVPVIPNLPFFFCAWRAWSHYRAYRASQYLSNLIEKQVIVPEPSDALDAIYRDCSPKPLASSHSSASVGQSPSTNDQEPLAVEMLLSREVVPTVVSTFSLTQSATADIYRAIQQADIRLSKSS